jgi:acetyl-CoA carboxylase carboxyl transferase subunit alpha
VVKYKSVEQHQYLPHEKQIQEYVKTIEHLKKQLDGNPLVQTELLRLEQKLEAQKKKVYSELTPWDRVLICRHPKRPHTVDYFRAITTDFFELHGDRTIGDDRAVIGGLAKIDEIPFVVIGQEKGSNTEERVACNFGMVSPEGFRKALRLMRLAEQLHVPILILLDTPGAYPGLEAEQRGQGWVIAESIQQMFAVTTPIIVLIIGEGCSGGALGMGIGDVVAMLEHAYYSVISPEGCASILWKDAGKKQEAANALKLNAEDLLDLNIVDEVLPEPLGGAHYDPEAMFTKVKAFVTGKARALRHIPLTILLEQRFMKFRKLGVISDTPVQPPSTLKV